MEEEREEKLNVGDMFRYESTIEKCEREERGWVEQHSKHSIGAFLRSQQDSLQHQQSVPLDHFASLSTCFFFWGLPLGGGTLGPRM